MVTKKATSGKGKKTAKGKVTKAIKKAGRGFFVSAEEFLESYNGDRQFVAKDGRAKLALTPTEVYRIGKNAPCPCGHCAYYTIELRKDGYWASIHTSKGVVITGNYKTGNATLTTAGRALGLYIY